MEKFSIKLKVWRQKNNETQGKFANYDVDDLNEHMSFLEMLDVLNERLISSREEPIAFEHDCREGICGSCSMVINGKPHGPLKGTTTCQLHMYHFNDGDNITIEPWRAKSFQVIGAWFAFGVIERLNKLETADILFKEDLLKRAEQEPKNLEIFMLLEELFKTSDKHQESIDQNIHTQIKLDHLEEQLSKALSDIEKIKDKVRQNGNSHSIDNVSR